MDHTETKIRKAFKIALNARLASDAELQKTFNARRVPRSVLLRVLFMGILAFVIINCSTIFLSTMKLLSDAPMSVFAGWAILNLILLTCIVSSVHHSLHNASDLSLWLYLPRTESDIKRFAFESMRHSLVLVVVANGVWELLMGLYHCQSMPFLLIHTLAVIMVVGVIAWAIWHWCEYLQKWARWIWGILICGLIINLAVVIISKSITMISITIDLISNYTPFGLIAQYLVFFNSATVTYYLLWILGAVLCFEFIRRSKHRNYSSWHLRDVFAGDIVANKVHIDEFEDEFSEVYTPGVNTIELLCGDDAVAVAADASVDTDSLRGKYRSQYQAIHNTESAYKATAQNWAKRSFINSVPRNSHFYFDFLYRSDADEPIVWKRWFKFFAVYLIVTWIAQLSGLVGIHLIGSVMSGIALVAIIPWPANLFPGIVKCGNYRNRLWNYYPIAPILVLDMNWKLQLRRWLVCCGKLPVLVFMIGYSWLPLETLLLICIKSVFLCVPLVFYSITLSINLKSVTTGSIYGNLKLVFNLMIVVNLLLMATVFFIASLSTTFTLYGLCVVGCLVQFMVFKRLLQSPKTELLGSVI